MTIIGNIILPRKDDFSMGDTEPKLPCLWYNTVAAGEPVDPDVIPGLFVYKDINGNLFSLYPLTTIEAVYGLNDKLSDLADAYKESEKKLDGKIKAASVELPADGWNEKNITVNVDGVTDMNTVIVSYAAESYEAYCEAAVRCTGQGNGTLSFECDFVPDSSVTANIVILNEV